MTDNPLPDSDPIAGLLLADAIVNECRRSKLPNHETTIAVTLALVTLCAEVGINRAQVVKMVECGLAAELGTVLTVGDVQ